MNKLNKFEKHYTLKKNTYYLKAGRIICYNDTELFSIHKLNMFPCECDSITHLIIEQLNKANFKKYHTEYMNS